MRDEAGVRTENLRIDNQQLTFVSNGAISSTRTDIGADAALADLALVDPRLAGRATASGRATATAGRSLCDPRRRNPRRPGDGRSDQLRLGFHTGQVDGADVTGTLLDGAGGLDGLVSDLGGDITVAGERRAISGLDVRVGLNHRPRRRQRRTAPARSGNYRPASTPSTSRSPRWRSSRPPGSVDATVELSAATVGQGVDLTAQARDVIVGDVLGLLDASNAQVNDAPRPRPRQRHARSPATSSSAASRSLLIGATATQTDAMAMQFQAQFASPSARSPTSPANSSASTTVSAARLDTRLRQQGVAATSAPATVTISGGAVDLTPVRLDFGTGSLTAQAGDEA